MSMNPLGVEARTGVSCHSLSAEMGMSFNQWSVSDFSPWECRTCTFLNEDPLHLTCQTCGEQRQRVNRTFSRGFNGEMMAAFSESMRRDIYGQGQLFVENQRQVLEKLKSAPEEASREIEDLQAALANEEREIEEMEVSLIIKKREIEEDEGSTIEELTGTSHMPGACKISPQAMNWMGQNRMLMDWKNLFEQKKAELNVLRDSICDR